MTMVALIMRSWIIEMRAYAGITCYILADDVLIIGAGMKMVSKFAKALNGTHTSTCTKWERRWHQTKATTLLAPIKLEDG